MLESLHPHCIEKLSHAILKLNEFPRGILISLAVTLSTGDHGGQGGSRAGVQRRKPHHRRQEGQREPGVPGSKASQLTDK